MRTDVLLSLSSLKLDGISDTPLLDCQIMLGHVLGKPREWLYGHSDATLTDTETTCFQQMLTRRQNGEPIAYITGTRSFWKREFMVTPAVLIPRPETELIIDTVLERLDDASINVLDLGTGSGAIAISLAAERTTWQVTGIDNSGEALSIARLNGEGLLNLDWLEGSWCNGIKAASVDLIVSNPPYVEEGDSHLDQLTFEPVSALTSGPDGLDAIRDIVPAGYHCLKTGGLLIVEHGYRQQPTVMSLFDAAGFKDVEGLVDLQGNPRLVLGKKP
ncbi:MAG: peptide chain release factor N(5)-glutamine methyltransferase [Gammaproteobacteria bacterium]|jgi:release factor glutamine methyltransferase|nr:peptide chain release factor N(5)-glutamine methyltransferase [Gammaproteobacteria bacterium]